MQIVNNLSSAKLIIHPKVLVSHVQSLINRIGNIFHKTLIFISESFQKIKDILPGWERKVLVTCDGKNFIDYAKEDLKSDRDSAQVMQGVSVAALCRRSRLLNKFKPMDLEFKKFYPLNQKKQEMLNNPLNQSEEKFPIKPKKRAKKVSFNIS